jgi:hypothetical protein
MASESRKLIIEIKTHSDASEADMSRHIDQVLEHLEVYAKSIPAKNWLNRVETSWDEGHNVKFDIDVKKRRR